MSRQYNLRWAIYRALFAAFFAVTAWIIGSGGDTAAQAQQACVSGPTSCNRPGEIPAGVSGETLLAALFGAGSPAAAPQPAQEDGARPARGCPSGMLAMRDGYCIPSGVTYCGGGRYCRSGACMANGSCCPNTMWKTSDGHCIPYSANHCGGGRYCSANAACMPNGTCCASPNRKTYDGYCVPFGVSYCGNGRYCRQGRCLPGNRCG